MIVEIALGISIFALVLAFIVGVWIYKKDAGTKEMVRISEAIRDGAKAYLTKQYLVIAVYFIIVFALLMSLAMMDYMPVKFPIAFLAGGILSALAGIIGMIIATLANVRTTQACKDSLNSGLRIAFNSGGVMGLSVVGLGLLGIILLYIWTKDPSQILAFGFGASSIALFARVGGGIYTKAADVGADMVGKVEAGIPEDDPRNPAVIADNVGDNVGDVAGMGADLFESYVGSIIAAMVIGAVALGAKGIMLPLAIASTGIISSVIGFTFVKVGKKTSVGKLHLALDKGIYSAAILMAIASYFVVGYVVGDIGLYWSTLLGLATGLGIGLATEHFTSSERKPVRRIARASKTGSFANIINGLAEGMGSTFLPVIAVTISIWLAYHFGGLYGIAIAAVGMLSTLGITLATDSYGPVADNAAGIAEMAKAGPDVRRRAEKLDAVGNTTAAIGKGFAIGSAALTALALFASYTQVTGLTSIDVMKVTVIIGVFLGAVLPFVFSAMTMKAVGRAAIKMVKEVRRQFETIPGILKGKAKPDYKRCVSISTQGALKEMIVPSIIAVIAPIVVGLMLGAEALGGLLVGTLVTGFMLAIFMANAGGAWDNAKKYIEEGHLGGKGSRAHKAAVVGDTVGDPLKDTSGPSLNILIKLISMVSLVFGSFVLAVG